MRSIIEETIDDSFEYTGPDQRYKGKVLWVEGTSAVIIMYAYCGCPKGLELLYYRLCTSGCGLKNQLDNLDP